MRGILRLWILSLICILNEWPRGSPSPCIQFVIYFLEQTILLSQCHCPRIYTFRMFFFFCGLLKKIIIFWAYWTWPSMKTKIPAYQDNSVFVVWSCSVWGQSSRCVDELLLKQPILAMEIRNEELGTWIPYLVFDFAHISQHSPLTVVRWPNVTTWGPVKIHFKWSGWLV